MIKSTMFSTLVSTNLISWFTAEISNPEVFKELNLENGYYIDVSCNTIYYYESVLTENEAKTLLLNSKIEEYKKDLSELETPETH